MIDAKPHRRWWTTGSGGERSDRYHTSPTVSLPSRKDEGHDGVGLSFTRQILPTIQVEKVGTRRRQQRRDITVKHVLPPFQKDGYTLLRETYLKTPGADRDSNHTIRN